LNSKDNFRFGLLIVAVGLVWLVSTTLLAPCITLPASCPPPLASQTQLTLAEEFVYVYGALLSMPLTDGGIIFMICGWVSGRKRLASLLALLILVATTAIVAAFFPTGVLFGLHIFPAINVISATISTAIVICAAVLQRI
jgi:hypothetical protein